MGNSFVAQVGNGASMQPGDNVMGDLFKQYERVIVESIITSFGLDFLVNDRYGGDVDTLHNVEKIGTDPQMIYKNKSNEYAYQNRGTYNTAEYHGDPRYKAIVKDTKENFRTTGKGMEDTYTGRTIFPTNKGVPLEKQGQLDHTISAKEIHNDRGRVLAGLSGVDLANDPQNLKFTNAALNNNMKDKSIPEYIKWCEDNPDKVNWNGKKGEPLPEDVKEKLLTEYEKSKKNYEKRKAQAYYTSSGFAKDVAKASGKVGAAMGIRQALGFVFMELWFSVKEEFQAAQKNSGMSCSEICEAIGNGLKKGIESAKSKYKEILEKFKEGFLAGALSSLTTTICNIFFTTAKNLIRIIRQCWASLVQALKVLFFNPDNLPLGERIRAVAKILATGASVVVGTVVTEAVQKTPLGQMPVIGDIVSTFCGVFVTGIMSCTLLFFLDRNEIVNKLVCVLNNISTIDKTVAYFREQAQYFERYAAELMQIDLEKFSKETAVFNSVTEQLENAGSEQEINDILKNTYEQLHIKLPWKGDFDTFMSDKNNRLVFE